MSKVFTAKSVWNSIDRGFDAIGRWIYQLFVGTLSAIAAIAIFGTMFMIVWKIIQWAWS